MTIVLHKTDAEAQVRALSSEDRVYMAQLVLGGWRFVPTLQDLFMAYLPDGRPMYDLQIQGTTLRAQLHHARHYQRTGERFRI